MYFTCKLKNPYRLKNKVTTKYIIIQIELGFDTFSLQKIDITHLLYFYQHILRFFNFRLIECLQ